MSAEIKTKRLFVGNLSFSTRWYELKDHFKQAGNVTYANIIRDRKSKRSRGCGVVEMETLEQAQQAINTLHETELAARKIFVREDQRTESEKAEQKQDGQQQERKPRGPKKEQAAQEGDKPQEKREKREKKPQAEKKVASEKKDVKAEEKKDTAAPVTTTDATDAQAEGEKKKKKRRRSKKKKATTATGDATAATATTAPSTATTAPKAEGDDEGGFREIKRRERRGRTTSRGGSKSESRGDRKGEPRVPKEKPTTESGEASPAPRQKKERQLDPTKSSGKAIFVSNLPLTFKAEELNQLFAEAGAIASSELKTDKSEKFRGLATVIFETPEAAQKAINTVNEKEVGGRKVNVRLDFYQ